MVDEPVIPPASFTHATSVSRDTKLLDWLASLASLSIWTIPISWLKEAPNDKDKGLQKLVKSWENSLTGLEQQFNNAHDFRDALNKFSVAHGFEYTFETNNARYVVATCKAEACFWSIQLQGCLPQLFLVKKMGELKAAEREKVRLGVHKSLVNCSRFL